MDSTPPLRLTSEKYSCGYRVLTKSFEWKSKVVFVSATFGLQRFCKLVLHRCSCCKWFFWHIKSCCNFSELRMESFGRSAKMRNCSSLYIGESQLTWSVGTLRAAGQGSCLGQVQGMDEERDWLATDLSLHGWTGRLQTYSELTHFDSMMTYFG